MYNNRARQAFNEPVDLDRLDSLANTNPLAKEQLLTEIKKMLNKAASLIGGYKPNDIEIIAIQLIKDGFSGNQIKQATETLISRFDKFPSYKELSMFVNQFKTKTNVTKAECLTCKNNGLVTRYHKLTGVNYAFSCDCIFGNAYPKFLKWSNARQMDYQEMRIN